MTGPSCSSTSFDLPPEDAQRFLDVWSQDTACMKRQPGYVSAQLLRGTASSRIFTNLAVWESAAALGTAFRDPEFQLAITGYPDGTVVTPHLFTKVAVPGICVA